MMVSVVSHFPSERGSRRLEAFSGSDEDMNFPPELSGGTESLSSSERQRTLRVNERLSEQM